MQVMAAIRPTTYTMKCRVAPKPARPGSARSATAAALIPVGDTPRPKQTRSNSATAAALLATDRKPPISAAAPSKTSGHQKWNGTADSLNARPTAIINPPRASTITLPLADPESTTRAISVAMLGRWQVPNSPPSRLMP